MHREEREFSIVLHLRAEFDENYTGDDDGFAWLERFDAALKPRIVNAVVHALRSDPAFHVVAAPRGRDPDVGVDLDVIYRPEATAAAST